MAKEDKRLMLQDLDLLVRPGAHRNLISLIGTCEHPDILYVALEHHPATLKDVLLESRILEHTPMEQQAQLSRFCSLSEHTVLNTLVGVAEGMKFLESKKVNRWIGINGQFSDYVLLQIFHKKLCASNIVMADGVNPKISGHGISEYCRSQQVC